VNSDFMLLSKTLVGYFNLLYLECALDKQNTSAILLV
jgi:hypothetical protein